MNRIDRPAVTAVLGPTNTGKTHLAIERMCGHSSGLMGFPLRLLAREVYDRVVALKGASQVALLTGEERICPPTARWFLCTAESMPTEGDYAFVALDEAQLGADPERGHVFTDRLLHARGREETMILGSAAIAPMVRALVKDVEIVSRPRFSTLSYAGAKKLSRLPRRSAIVAFSAEEVYAVAEMLRRTRGGAAIVMGALSPRTRNAQVRMFMEGEVDYLVATDAIGMGLNLDVAHVAFASLRKFDGKRTRRLTVAEMAQIAGRAGRHHKDGTFGSLGAEDGAAAFTPEEVLAIEEHRFPKLDFLYWRDGAPRMDSIDRLIADLEARPDRPELRAAPEATDLGVLKRMADDPLVRERVRNAAQVSRLWAACGIPDFQKLGPEHHGRIVSRIWRFLSEGRGQIPSDWFAQQVARLDDVKGDIDTLSGRIAAARTWSYVAHRVDWLADPQGMAERTRRLEEKLSDALHAALTQRFVDRRTTVLLRDIGGKASELPVRVDASGDVSVDGEHIGRLDGFAFSVDPDARGGDRRMLLAAAERRLGKMLGMKAEELLAAEDAAFALDATPGAQPTILWNGAKVADLVAGASLTAPAVRLDRPLLALAQDIQKRVVDRLNGWIGVQKDKHLLPLVKMTESASDPAVPAVVRAVFAQLADAGGIAARTDMDAALGHLDKEQRSFLRKAGLTIGVLDIFHPGLLKPGAAMWRMALLAARSGKPMLPLPAAGAVLLTIEDRMAATGARVSGFRGFGAQYARIDMAERIARAAHEAIAKGEPFMATSTQVVSLGLSEQSFLQLMRAAGFRPIATKPVFAPVAEPVPEGEAVEGGEAVETAPEAVAPAGANWAFRGRPKPQRRPEQAQSPQRGKPGASAGPSGGGSGAFADLAALLGRNG